MVVSPVAVLLAEGQRETSAVNNASSQRYSPQHLAISGKTLHPKRLHNDNLQHPSKACRSASQGATTRRENRR